MQCRYHLAMNRTGSFDPFPLGLGISQHYIAAVGIYFDNPVEHILAAGSCVQHNITLLRRHFHGTQIYRITMVEEGRHAASRYGDRHVGVPFPKQPAEHIQIFLCIDFFHSVTAPLFHHIGIRSRCQGCKNSKRIPTLTSISISAIMYRNMNFFLIIDLN